MSYNIYMKKIVLNYSILSLVLFILPHILVAGASYMKVTVDGGWIIVYFALLPLIISLFMYVYYKSKYQHTGRLIRIMILNTIVLYILLGIYTWYMFGLAFTNSRWI
jgi:ABC-type amino acid transport system permease subunit